MAQKKEKVYTLDEIKKELEKKEPKDQRKFLNVLIGKKEYTQLQKQIIKLLVQAIRKDSPITEYKLTYDALNEGIEPIYFWILDFMQEKAPAGLGLEVHKSQEAYEASVASGYYGEMGQRATIMQGKGAEYLGAINNVIKSLLNLIYDLNEFKMRLVLYEELKGKDEDKKLGANYALKGIWMDSVDSRNGMGSINSLAQQLNFTEIRDWFMFCKDMETAKRVDTNERVRRILIKKLHEYWEWLKLSESELKKRYTIEKAYLRSQKDTLKLYATWAKPYLLAAKKLHMKEFNTPDIVSVFSNMQVELALYGKKSYDGKSAHPSFKDLKIEKKYYEVVEVTMNFRSVPQVYQSQGGRQYIHGGKSTIFFRGYILDDNEMKAYDEHELYESFELIEDWVGDSLKVIEEEIQKYLIEDEPKTAEEKKEESLVANIKENLKGLKEENLFKDIYKGFEEFLKPLVTKKERGATPEVYKVIEKEAKINVEKRTGLIYETYKKTHGMLA